MCRITNNIQCFLMFFYTTKDIYISLYLFLRLFSRGRKIIHITTTEEYAFVNSKMCSIYPLALAQITPRLQCMEDIETLDNHQGKEYNHLELVCVYEMP